MRDWHEYEHGERELTTPSFAPSVWDKPDMALLGSGRRRAPVFPAAVLGPFWERWVVTQAEGACAPTDYVAVPLLACTGATLGNVRWPVAGPWSEPPILWAACVGAPSSGKSPGADCALANVNHAETLLSRGFEEELANYVTDKQVADAKREAWKGEVGKAVQGNIPPPPMPADAAELQAPIRPRIRIADTTTEKLGVLAAGLPRGLLLQRDELSGWFGAFDKYGGSGSDRAFAIEMYGGRSYVIDRVKNAEPIRVRHLSVGVLGGIQPDKLGGIIDAHDDGLVSRVLWAWPDVLPDFRLARTTLPEAIEAKNNFGQLAWLRAGSDEEGHPEPIRVHLSPEALNELEAVGRRLAKRAHEAWGMFAGCLGKGRGHVLRLSCVLEYLWWIAKTEATEPQSISMEAVKAATALVEDYFLPMAERVLGDASIPPAERAAMRLARHLAKNGVLDFNARELRREIGGDVRDAKAMSAACEFLIEAGLIRPKRSRIGERTGRQAQNYEVNPFILESRANSAISANSRAFGTNGTNGTRWGWADTDGETSHG
jgi:hypothetical protein